MRRTPSRKTVLVLAAALAVAAALVGLGLFRVGSGEVAVAARGGGEVRVYESGWHWRLPGSAELVRLPREPIALDHEVELRTAEGAAIVVDVAGRFGVAAGEEPAWVEAASGERFVDALWRLVAEALTPAVRGADPAEIFRPEAGRRLSGRIVERLAEVGVEVAALEVSVPAERNPVAAAVLRSQMAELAGPRHRKVLLVGWDGADWLMIRPLIAAGRLPHLAGLIRSGVSGELRSENPLLSPLVWTTIATGKTVPEHGIADFLVRDPATGGLVPISSTSRKVHALWSALPAFGRTADVVAWWATWPAEKIDGTMVTDRVAYQLFDVQVDSSAAGKVYPPAAWERVAELLVPAEEVPWSTVRRFVDVPEAELERRWQSLPPDRRQEEKTNHLRKILATTASYHAIALDLLRDQADLTMVYYEGTDTVGHLFARYLPPRLPGVSAEEVAAYGGALAAFYEHADELLGELLAAADPDTEVILVSDHGFFTGEARPASDPSNFAEGAPQWHRLYGVVVAAGPGLGRREVEGATIFDVAPTVLALLGVPVPADLPGRVLPELLPSGVTPPPAGRLASFEVLPRARPEGETRVASELDEERLRELVALGYISPTVLEQRGGRGGEGAGGGGVPAPSDSAAASPSPGAAGGAGGGDLEAVSTEAYNLGRIYQRQGDLDKATEQYRLAVERLPSFGLGYASLAQVAAVRGDHSRAFDILVEGFSKSGTMPRSAITGLVDEAVRSGRLPEAERALERLRQAYSADAALYAALGLLYENTDRVEPALEQYRRALALDPLDQLSTEQTVSLLRKLGREREAREFLERSFETAAGKVTAMNQLAVVALRQGWADQAERLLRRVLASDPGNPGVLANLAASLMQQGKRAEALVAMQQAVARDPGDARNQFNLGAMLAEQGRFAEALAAFQAASERGLRTPQVHIAAAKMHFRLGDRSKAEAELEKALTLAPGDPEARELLSILRQG